MQAYLTTETGERSFTSTHGTIAGCVLPESGGGNRNHGDMSGPGRQSEGLSTKAYVTEHVCHTVECSAAPAD